MKKDWVLSQKDFDKLLKWLSPDREQAGAEYERIRRGLIKIFYHRGLEEPESLADETINRVTSKIEELGNKDISIPEKYFYGVAKMICLEKTSRKKVFQMRRIISGFFPVFPTFYNIEKSFQEKIHDCLDECLEKLPQSKRELILRYFGVKKEERFAERILISETLDMTMFALRVEISRIRKRIEICLAECLSKK